MYAVMNLACVRFFSRICTTTKYGVEGSSASLRAAPPGMFLLYNSMLGSSKTDLIQSSRSALPRSKIALSFAPGALSQ
jgi:hypothetical protein